MPGKAHKLSETLPAFQLSGCPSRTYSNKSPEWVTSIFVLPNLKPEKPGAQWVECFLDTYKALTSILAS